MFERFGLKALKHSAFNVALVLTLVVTPLIGVYLARR